MKDALTDRRTKINKDQSMEERSDNVGDALSKTLTNHVERTTPRNEYRSINKWESEKKMTPKMKGRMKNIKIKNEKKTITIENQLYLHQRKSYSTIVTKQKNSSLGLSGLIMYTMT